MAPRVALGLQFVGFFAAWLTIALVWIRPAIADWDRRDRLALWVTPLMFRVLGVGLLVDALSPGLDPEFARNTAIGDSLTAVLALAALVALRKRLGLGVGLAWAANLVGAVDLAIALPHAARVGAAEHLGAQWYVPAAGVPAMIVAHVMGLSTLLRAPDR